MVRPASRIFRAISFGVFCRSAPSTRAIMRSRKVSPGLEVMRTLIWSESTRGAAGHRRAVAAGFANHGRRFAGNGRFIDGSDALDDLAIAGNELAGDHRPRHRRCATWSRAPVLGSVREQCDWPWSRLRALRSASAWALPRPSAMASAKFANSTVNHSHSVIWRSKPNAGAPPRTQQDRDSDHSSPTSTTNMTGFFIMRGISFRIES